MIDPAIQLIEKPDEVSWELIHEVIWKSHESNREVGMSMSHAGFSGADIETYLGPKGKMYVALLDGKVIGTLAFTEKKSKFWFGEDTFAYCCFAAVLPEYRGHGVYGGLMKLCEQAAISRGLDKMLFNTHPKNARVIDTALKNGYKKISYTLSKNSAWVYLVKWLNGSPYSDLKLNIIYGGLKTVRKAEWGLTQLFRR